MRWLWRGGGSELGLEVRYHPEALADGRDWDTYGFGGDAGIGDAASVG